MKKVVLFFFFFCANSFSSPQDEFCGGIKNFAFKDGEQVNFHVYYTVIGIYVHAGNASFSVKSINYQQRPAYQFVGTGTSNSGYDWIFKVRDRYESVVDTATLHPLQFLPHFVKGRLGNIHVSICHGTSFRLDKKNTTPLTVAL